MAVELNVKFNVKRRYIINGKEYHSLEEMPGDVRQAYEKGIASSSGGHLKIGPASHKTKITFNGQEYESIEAMPPNIRQMYEQVMRAVETGTLSPEMIGQGTGGFPGAARIQSVKSIKPGSSGLRWFAAGFMLIVLLFGLYYLLHRVF